MSSYVFSFLLKEISSQENINILLPLHYAAQFSRLPESLNKAPRLTKHVDSLLLVDIDDVD